MGVLTLSIFQSLVLMIQPVPKDWKLQLKSLESKWEIAHSKGDSKSQLEVLSEEFRIGDALAESAPHQGLSTFFGDHRDQAVEILSRISERAPGTKIARDALWVLGNLHLNLKENANAEGVFRLFIENANQDEREALAHELRLRAALGQYRGKEYDVSCLDRAEKYAAQIKEKYPEEAEDLLKNYANELETLDERRAESMFEQASFYRRRNDSVSERYVLKRLIKKFPVTTWAERASQLIAH